MKRERLSQVDLFKVYKWIDANREIAATLPSRTVASRASRDLGLKVVKNHILVACEAAGITRTPHRGNGRIVGGGNAPYIARKLNDLLVSLGQPSDETLLRIARRHAPLTSDHPANNTTEDQ